MAGHSDSGRAQRAVLWTGALLGAGVVGSLDEIVFHQLIQWHNFYVETTQRWRIISDGLFHIFTAALLFYGALRLWDQRRLLPASGTGRALAAGILLGGGGFQLFDGIVLHKVLQLHPVREGVSPIWPYDMAWIASGAALLLAGWFLWRRIRAGEPAGASAAAPAGR